jgi:hypothetical protein
VRRHVTPSGLLQSGNLGRGERVFQTAWRRPAPEATAGSDIRQSWLPPAVRSPCCQRGSGCSSRTAGRIKFQTILGSGSHIREHQNRVVSAFNDSWQRHCFWRPDPRQTFSVVASLSIINGLRARGFPRFGFVSVNTCTDVRAGSTGTRRGSAAARRGSSSGI